MREKESSLWKRGDEGPVQGGESRRLSEECKWRGMGVREVGPGGGVTHRGVVLGEALTEKP